MDCGHAVFAGLLRGGGDKQIGGNQGPFFLQLIEQQVYRMATAHIH